MVVWEFNEADPSDVDIEMTQRDQFNNEDVDLSQDLVRETIQNSLDAAMDGGPVKVRFSLRNLIGIELEQFKTHYQELLPHLTAWWH